jgi:hypothetical protein
MALGKPAAYYAALLKHCNGVNSDRPELVRAKALERFHDCCIRLHG